VGAGIISAGALLLGSHELAGRLAHVAAADDGPLCYCGANGCLTTHLSAAALSRAVGGDGREGTSALAQRLSDLGPDHPTVRRLIVLLTRDLRTLVAILDPDIIVLAGALSALLRVAGSEINDSLALTNFDAARHAVQVVEPSLGSEQLHVGASDIGFTPLLDDPSHVLAAAADQ